MIWQWSEQVLLIPELRAEVHEWLRERDVDPTSVPISGWLWETDGKVEMVVFQPNPERPNQILWDEEKKIPKMTKAIVDGPLPDDHLICTTNYDTADDWIQMTLGVPE